jgi:hypothetical protein
LSCDLETSQLYFEVDSCTGNCREHQPPLLKISLPFWANFPAIARLSYSSTFRVIFQSLKISPRTTMAADLESQLKTVQTSTGTVDSAEAGAKSNVKSAVGLKRVPPYWHPYSTMAKGRWFNREILELVSTEFRDRSIDYYVRLGLNTFIVIENAEILLHW